MSVIATALKHLIAAGVSGDDLVRAVAEMEEAQPIDRVAEKRRAYDRERKRAAKAINSTGIPPESVETAETPPFLDKETSPRPPKEIKPIPGLSDANASSPALQPEHVVEAWNDMAGRCGLPKAKLTPPRRRALTSRIRQHTISDFTEAIGAVERSPFLLGENDRAWRADFDFLLQPKSFIRLIEGSYDRGK